MFLAYFELNKTLNSRTNDTLEAAVQPHYLILSALSPFRRQLGAISTSQILVLAFQVLIFLPWGLDDDLLALVSETLKNLFVGSNMCDR